MPASLSESIFPRSLGVVRQRLQAARRWLRPDGGGGLRADDYGQRLRQLVARLPPESRIGFANGAASDHGSAFDGGAVWAAGRGTRVEWGTDSASSTGNAGDVPPRLAATFDVIIVSGGFNTMRAEVRACALDQLRQLLVVDGYLVLAWAESDCAAAPNRPSRPHVDGRSAVGVADWRGSRTALDAQLQAHGFGRVASGDGLLGAAARCRRVWPLRPGPPRASPRGFPFGGSLSFESHPDGVRVFRKLGTRMAPHVARSVRCAVHAAAGTDLFRIPTHLTERERAGLFHLAHGLGPHAIIVAIGSSLGASSSFLAAGGRVAGATVYAVDICRDQAMSEGPRNTYEAFRRNTAHAGDAIVPLVGLSGEMAADFDPPIDLLFVDGDHGYEGVRGDLDTWLPKMRAGGIVALHDYGGSPAVRRAARELVVPRQLEGGHVVDSTYWTRVGDRGANSPVAASVLVPTCGRPELLGPALLSLASQQLPGDDFEVVVIDNSPSAALATLVDQLSKSAGRRIRYVAEPAGGLHNARHAGARAAKGSVLAYVDDDVIAPKGWLRALLEPFADDAVGMVGGRVIVRWEAEPPAWVANLPPGYFSALDLGARARPIEWPETIHGCNLAVRRSVLYEVGGFNPDGFSDSAMLRFRGDGETGLQRKVQRAGFRVVYTPDGWLHHVIPARRLEPAAIRRRGTLDGLSASYAALRASADRRSFLPRAAARAVKALGRHGAYTTVAAASGSARHIYRAKAAAARAYAEQHLLALADPMLRDYLLRDCYLDARERPLEPIDD